MTDYRPAFEAFATGFAAAFAAGYADVAPERARWREQEEIEAAIFDDNEPWDVGYGSGQWYVDEGEWVQVPEDPWVESKRRRAEEARRRRGYGAWVADGKARFAAGRAPHGKNAGEDFSLDLLSAFAAAYVIGSGGWARFEDVLSNESLYDAAGVPPDVKAGLLAAYEVYQGPFGPRQGPFRHDDEEKLGTASDFGFIDSSLPAGPLACYLRDGGYDSGWNDGYRAVLRAIVNFCSDNGDIADRVKSGVSEALGHDAQSDGKKTRSVRRGTSWPNAPRVQ